MSRYRRRAGASDSEVSLDGDMQFLGVDMRRRPEQLEPGLAALAINKVFTQGRAEPRKGMRTIKWARELGVNFPIDFPVDFTTEQGLGTAFGACVFADPYGQEYALIACANVAYRLTPNAPISSVAYPSGITIDDAVNFTQAFNVLLMWRGENLRPLKLETGTLFTGERAFELVPDDEEPSEDYTSSIPGALRGLHYGNRVWVGFERSRVAFSDILSYTRYDQDFSEIFVNSGEDDTLQILFPLGENCIIAFKDQSIYAITGVLPDPSTDGSLQVVTTERGAVAPDSVVQVGKDVWFLSGDGVYAVSQALDNKLQAISEPISAPMEPLFRRVNWAFAHRAQAVVQGNRYLLALPIDHATYNNAIVVFDFLNNAWSGWWEGPWVDVRKFLRLTVNGERRLFIVTGASAADQAARGAVLLLEEGFTDVLFGGENSVDDLLVTRAYVVGTNSPKRFLTAAVEVESWYGAADIAVRLDGVNESRELGGYTKDRTRYYTFGKPPYDTSNVNGDHGVQGREDYSVVLAGSQNWDGINPGLHQHSSERFRIRETSRSLQLAIHGSRGRNVVKAVQVEAAADREEQRTDA